MCAAAQQRQMTLGLPLSPETHLRTLHGSHDANVVLFHKRQSGDPWHRSYDDFGEAIAAAGFAPDLTDLYVSQSGFTPYGRRTVNAVTALPCAWVDLDYYNLPRLRHLNVRELTERILNDHPWLPDPTLVAHSGRGAYLIWLFDTHLERGRLHQWQFVMDNLVEFLRDYGADPMAKDAARVLRVSGSKHSKSDSSVAYFAVGKQVPFRALQKAVQREVEAQQALPSPPVLDGLEGSVQASEGPLFEVIEGRRDHSAKRSSKQTPSQQRAARQNAYKVAQGRMRDLHVLAEIRGGVSVGHRQNFALIFASCAAWFCPSRDALEGEVQEFVRTHYALRDQREFGLKAVRNVLDKYDADRQSDVQRIWNGKPVPHRYRFKDRTIISRLGITPDELEKLSQISAKTLTEKRRAAGVQSRDEYLTKAEKRRREALRLSQEGMQNSQIAAVLGVTIRSVQKYLR